MSDIKKFSGYSKEFVQMIIDAHKGHECLSKYKEWIEGQLSSVEASLILAKQIEYILKKPIKKMKILVFGCGFGGSSVALALNGGIVYGVDIDEKCIAITQRRAKEYNVSDGITLSCYKDTKKLEFPDNMFDIVTCEAVLEHIERDRSVYIKEIWRVLKKRGSLHISSTPNILYPYDFHTTNLFLIPWIPSSLAKRYAVFRKRCLPADNLELMGRRGTSYWFILNSLKGENYRVIGNSRKCNLVSYLLSQKRLTNIRKRLVFPLLWIFNYFVAVPFKIPIGAFLPNLTFIAIQKDS